MTWPLLGGHHATCSHRCGSAQLASGPARFVHAHVHVRVLVAASIVVVVVVIAVAVAPQL